MKKLSISSLTSAWVWLAVSVVESEDVELEAAEPIDPVESADAVSETAIGVEFAVGDERTNGSLCTV